MEQQQPAAELDNVHPAEAGLEMPVVMGEEHVDPKDRMVIGFWRDSIDAEFTVQGLEYHNDHTRDVLSERFERIKLDAVITRRRRLEESNLFRHPIPYALIHRYNEAKNQIEFFVYQRTKKVGESKLAGNHSLGGGGHPEAQSMRFYPNWTLNAKEALISSLIDELDEEFIWGGKTFQELVRDTAITFSQEGFIRDDVNEVGRQHLGIVYSIGIPPHIDVECREEELLTVGWYTLEEIVDPATGFNLERWSYILADNLIRMAAEERAKAAAQAHEQDEIALATRLESERIAKLPAQPLSLEVANAYLESSQFDLLNWKLEDGELVTEREGKAFFDGYINHPIDGRKAIVIALDPADPAPDQTIAAIKAEVTAQWETLKGNPVAIDEPEIETGEDGCELEQEEDGDLPDDLDEEPVDEEEPGEEVRLPESVERRADGGLNVNYGDNPEIGRGLSRPIELNPELQAQAITAHERASEPTYPRGGRPEFAQIDEAPFRHDPTPARDSSPDVGGYDSGDSGSSSTD